MKTVDLHLELKRRGLSQTGSKDVLVERLKQNSSSKTRKKNPANTESPSVRFSTSRDGDGLVSNSSMSGTDISCKCGCIDNDGKPMIQCHICDRWSHHHCYYISVEQAQSVLFICHHCIHSDKVVTECICHKTAREVTELQQLIHKQNQQVNSMMLTLRDKIQSIDTRGVSVVDSMNVLSQQLDSLSDIITGMRRDQNLEKRKVNKAQASKVIVRDSGKDPRRSIYHQSLPPLRASGRPTQEELLMDVASYVKFLIEGIDASNSVSVIGRMIEGVFEDSAVPAFVVERARGSLEIPPFTIGMPPDAAAVFPQLWQAKVRLDLGFQ
jgi:hypothetical protein